MSFITGTVGGPSDEDHTFHAAVSTGAPLTFSNSDAHRAVIPKLSTSLLLALAVPHDAVSHSVTKIVVGRFLAIADLSMAAPRQWWWRALPHLTLGSRNVVTADLPPFALPALVRLTITDLPTACSLAQLSSVRSATLHAMTVPIAETVATLPSLTSLTCVGDQWGDVNLSPDGVPPPSKASCVRSLECLRPITPQLTVLDVSFMPLPLEVIISDMVALERLHVKTSDLSASACSALPSLPSLVDVDIDVSTVEALPYVNELCHVNKLALTSNLTTDSVVTLPGATSLQTLSLISIGVSPEFFTGKHQLRSVELSAVTVSPAMCAAMSAAPALEFVTFTLCEKLDGGCVAALAESKSLVSFKVELMQLTLTVEDVVPLSGVPTLRRVDVEGLARSKLRPYFPLCVDTGAEPDSDESFGY